MKFNASKKDYELSPYTGLTRETWIEAAEYMLEGIFRHIKDYESPVVVPRQETEITYPHKNATPEDYKTQVKAEIFEGLTRSFFIAAPLIHCKSEVEVAGFKLKDYYKHQVLRTCTPGDEYFAGNYEELQKITNYENPFRAYQQTVETSALVICLWACKEELWDTYTQKEKDTIAAFLDSFAKANTVPQNWRLFNMLDMAFLHSNGYKINKNIMKDHAQAILEYYTGDGWYRDGQSFDYYSCWAFNFYAPLWNEWYGYENEPYLAKRFEENSNKLMETYPDFFDQDGWTNMWGRSNIYRFAATSSFDGNMMLKNSSVNPGLARRICSGSLLQFLNRDDFLKDGIPTMGFYKQFKPLVQGYSCTESPFWLGKAFMCLHLPKGSPFWTEKESEGSFEKLKENEVKETVLNGPALCFTNHKANGETILRTAKIVKHKKDIHGMWNYSKLCYNTKYPWESTPVSGEIIPSSVESQQYVIYDETTKTPILGNATFWIGKKDNELYRKQYFEYETETETHWRQNIFLCDMGVPYGILRCDKLKLHRRPVKITLGSYGFSDNGTTIETKEKDGFKAIILKGKDSQGKEHQMAMTIFAGWEDIKVIKSSGTNPDSENSLVIYGECNLKKQYDGSEPYVLISQVITKENHEDWTDEQLFPISSIEWTDENKCGCYGPVKLTMKDGSIHNISYELLEGNLSL